MKIQFQADNDFNGRIIRAVLRLNPAIDFQTAPEIGLHLGTPDDEVLRLAAQDNRILVSGDFKRCPIISLISLRNNNRRESFSLRKSFPSAKRPTHCTLSGKPARLKNMSTEFIV